MKLRRTVPLRLVIAAGLAIASAGGIDMGCGGGHPTGTGGAPGGTGGMIMVSGAGGKPVTPLPGDWRPCGAFGAIGLQSAVLSANGQVMALSFFDRSVDVVRVGDGATLLHVPDAFPTDYAGSYFPIALSPSGQVLAITEPQITFIQISSGAVLYHGGDGMILTHFSPDGARLIGIVLNGHAVVVNVPGGSLAGTYGGARFIIEAAFSPAGAVITLDDAKLVRDETNGVESSLAVDGLAGLPELSPNGRYLAGVVPDTNGSRTSVYRIADRQLMWSRIDSAPEMYPASFQFSTDETTLVEEGSDETHIFDLATGTLRASMPRALPTTWWLGGPMGTPLYAVDAVGTMVWTGADLSHAQPLNTTSGIGTGDEIASIAVSGDGKSVAIASAHAVTLWDLATHSQRWAVRHGAASVAFSPDGARVLAAGPWVRELGAATGSTGPTSAARCVPGLSARYAPDATKIAVSLPWGFLILGNAADPTFAPIQSPGLPLAALAFAPDGRSLATAEPALYRWPELTRLWPSTPPAAAPADVCKLPDATQLPGAVAISPDGTLIAVRPSVDFAQAAPHTELRRADTGALVRIVATGFGAAPVFSPDSAWLLTGKTARRTDGGGTPITLDLPEDQPVSTFAPDGTIVAGTSDGRVSLFCPAVPGAP